MSCRFIAWRMPGGCLMKPWTMTWHLLHISCRRYKNCVSWCEIVKNKIYLLMRSKLYGRSNPFRGTCKNRYRIAETNRNLSNRIKHARCSWPETYVEKNRLKREYTIDVIHLNGLGFIIFYKEVNDYLKKTNE